jgi:hypothetical protein
MNIEKKDRLPQRPVSGQRHLYVLTEATEVLLPLSPASPVGRWLAPIRTAARCVIAPLWALQALGGRGSGSFHRSPPFHRRCVNLEGNKNLEIAIMG